MDVYLHVPFTVEVPEDPIVDIQVFSTSCFGSSDGSINVTQVGEGFMNIYGLFQMELFLTLKT